MTGSRPPWPAPTGRPASSAADSPATAPAEQAPDGPVPAPAERSSARRPTSHRARSAAARARRAAHRIWSPVRARWSTWSPGRQALAAAAAAVAVFVVVAVGALLYSLARPPAAPPASASPTTPAVAPGDLLRRSAAILRATTSAHIQGRFQDAAGVQVDLSIDPAGNAAGTVVTGGVRVDVVRMGGRIYVRSRQLVERVAGSLVASYVGDHWLLLDAARFSSTGVPQALAEATSLAGVADLVESGATTARLGPTVTVDGRRAVEVVTLTGRIDVESGPSPYPLRIEEGGLTDLTLDRFDAPTVVAPPSGGVVDLSHLPWLG